MNAFPTPPRPSHDTAHGRRRRTGALMTALALAGVTVTVAPAAQAAPRTETVTMNWLRSETGPTPPFTGTGSGTFSAAGPVSDAGTLSLVGQNVAVASPVLAAARTQRTLSSPQGTLELRCFERTKDFSNLAAIPFTGSCAIAGGTRAYSDLHGHGDFTTATIDLFTSSVTETLALDVS